jgi:hypothetical protein
LQTIFSNFWSDFWPNLASDVISSVILGTIIAFAFYKFQKKDAERAEKEKLEKERQMRKKKILDLVSKELLVNYKVVRLFLQTYGKSQIEHMEKFDVIYSFAYQMKDELWRAFSDGGELRWINDIDVLDKLTSAYHSIYKIKYAGNAYIQYGFYELPSQGPVISEYLEKNLDELAKSAKTKIKDALNCIENELNGIINL